MKITIETEKKKIKFNPLKIFLIYVICVLVFTGIIIVAVLLNTN